jgi:peptide/nickel transport system permease protein
MAAAVPGTRRNWQRSLLHDRKVVIGLAIIVFFVLLGVVGPFLVQNPSATSQDTLAGPSAAHLLGTTDTGQDVLAQLVVGTRVSLVVGLVAAALATALATVVGLSSAFLGGLWDEVLSLLANVFLVLPALPLVIVLAGYLQGAGTLAVAVVISVTGWSWTARILRAQTLSLRNRDFVQAARAAGESTWRIITAEILPLEVPLIAAQFIITVVYAILTQAGLAFLGIGSVTTWSWGTMLYWAQNAQALSLGAWWWFVPPGICLALLGTGLALLNFGIDEITSPQLRTGRRGARRRKPAAVGVLAPVAGIGAPISGGTVAGGTVSGNPGQPGQEIGVAP